MQRNQLRRLESPPPSRAAEALACLAYLLVVLAVVALGAFLAVPLR